MTVPRGTIPEGFLQSCMKYEYLKRNRPQRARQNLCDMIQDLPNDIISQLPIVENLCEVPKQFRVDGDQTVSSKTKRQLEEPSTSSPLPKKARPSQPTSGYGHELRVLPGTTPEMSIKKAVETKQKNEEKSEDVNNLPGTSAAMNLKKAVETMQEKEKTPDGAPLGASSGSFSRGASEISSERHIELAPETHSGRSSRASLDTDSDKSTIDDPAKERIEYLLLEQIKWFYGKMASTELRRIVNSADISPRFEDGTAYQTTTDLEELMERSVNLGSEDEPKNDEKADVKFGEIWKVICIQGLVPLLSFDGGVNFPICSLKVTIGYRKLAFEFKNERDEEFRIRYVSCDGGCLVWYEDDVKFIDGIKYQEVAAQDFYNLVSDTTYEELEFDIEDYNEWNPPIWPFSKFYRKIEKHLPKTMLRVKRLTMKIFKEFLFENEVHANRVMMAHLNLNSIWKNLVPGVLKSVKIRVWNDEQLFLKRKLSKPDDVDEFFKDFYKTDTYWKTIQSLDIVDDELEVDRNSFMNYFHFNDVHLKMRQEYLPDLLEAFRNFEINNNEIHDCIFHFYGGFDYETARQDIDTLTDDGQIGYGRTVTLGRELDGVVTIRFHTESTRRQRLSSVLSRPKDLKKPENASKNSRRTV